MLLESPATTARRTPSAAAQCAPAAQCAADSREFCVEFRPLDQLSDLDLQRWSDLAERAMEPNPFHKPEFVLPAAKHLLRSSSLGVLSVHDASSGRWMYANAVMDRRPTVWRPLRRLCSLSSRYSLLDHPLLDAEGAASTTETLFKQLTSGARWHGIRFARTTVGAAQDRHCRRAAASHGVKVHLDHEWRRPVYDLRLSNSDELLSGLSKSRRKSLRQGWRWLESRGRVEHRIVTPAPDDPGPAERFLRLESLGWKGRSGSAIGADQADRAFYREMVRRFAAHGRIHFGELLVGGEVIASTCNLQAGRVLFGFKIGWAPAYGRGSPGAWAELKLIEDAAAQPMGVERIDSCSTSGSYVAPLYRESVPTASLVYAWSGSAAALCRVREAVRAVKSSLRRFQPAQRPDAEPRE